MIPTSPRSSATRWRSPATPSRSRPRGPGASSACPPGGPTWCCSTSGCRGRRTRWCWAFDFIPKPFQLAVIERVVAAAIAERVRRTRSLAVGAARLAGGGAAAAASVAEAALGLGQLGGQGLHLSRGLVRRGLLLARETLAFLGLARALLARFFESRAAFGRAALGVGLLGGSLTARQDFQRGGRGAGEHLEARCGQLGGQAAVTEVVGVPRVDRRALQRARD